MKKISLIIAVILCCTLFSAVTFAHPPKAPEITWNANTHTLTVKATHTVNNPAKHYVMALVVSNSKGETIATKQYTKQPSDTAFCDSALLSDVKSGDTVNVKLICNIMGTVEKEFKIQ